MKLITSIALLGFIFGCATVPKELRDAREAYARASDSPNIHKASDSLREAKDALAVAEKSYKDHSKSYKTLDLAYVAERKAQLAEARAAVANAGDRSKNANRAMEDTQNQIIQKNKQELSDSKDAFNQAQLDAANELNQAQRDAANELRLALANKASVKEDKRGLVITLSGSVLFASGKSELLPEAQSRLNDVSGALMKTEDRSLLVEGHTDSVGSADYNMGLSQRRADAVRSYLISHGYSADLISAQGLGKDRPIASNKTPEGRANNRRVEIIVKN